MARPSEQELAFLDAPESELDLLIGEAVIAEDFGSQDLTDAEKQEMGRRWFDLHRKELRRAICIDSPLRTKLFATDSMDRTDLFAGVIDAVGMVTLGIPVPVAVLSARLVKYGLERLCTEPAADTTEA